MITKERSKRKQTGGRYRDYRKKRLSGSGSPATLTRIGAALVNRVRILGGNTKFRVLVAETANVLDKKTGRFVKAKIRTVVDAPADRHYIRRNILVKGSVIDTELGKAVVTNRPGQEGTVNAVLI